MGVRLPAEYQEVEYLESTGTQYINMFPDDPAPNPESYLKIKLDGAITNGLSYETGLFGGKHNDALNSPTLFTPLRSALLQSWCGGSTQFDSGFTIVAGTKYFMESTWITGSGRIISVNGDTATGNQSNALMATDEVRHFCLFKDGTRTGQSYASSLRVYAFLLIIDDLTLRNLVPCYRKSDDEPGMYDLVSKTFFTNQGTGEFLVGPDVVDNISPRLMDRRRVLIAKLTSLFKNIITSQTDESHL